MKLDLTVQRVCAGDTVPEDDVLRTAAEAALQGRRDGAELCIRIVDEAESAELNRTYRGKDGPTNVLSFPCDAELPGIALLGDLAVCAPVVAAEARAQDKTLAAHWSHLVVHGVLHLLGHDHIGDHEARAMESEERRILARLGYADPYRTSPPTTANSP